MLNYGLVCTAISDDRKQLREGTRLLADIAHKYNIPVTWAITSDTVQYLAKELTEWHSEFGDEPLLMLDIKKIWDSNWSTLTGVSEFDADGENEVTNVMDSSASPETVAEHIVKMREVLPSYIRTEWRKIQQALDWVNPSVAGVEWKNHVLVQALEQEGFRGLWGYHWDERGTIVEDDRGCPFGFFYPSGEQHNFSAPASGSITGIPYYSAAHLDDDADNLRASLINNTIRHNYDLYVDNDRWNQWLCYVQHISALDVMQLGQESIDRLEAYFSHVASNDSTKLLPLSEMVDDYWTSCQQTEPTFIIANTPEKRNNIDSVTIDPSIAIKPIESGIGTVRKTLFYYDSECQLTFIDGVMEPTEMKNYISPPVLDNLDRGVSHQSASNHGVEYHLPKVLHFRPDRKRTRLHITFSIESTKAMPYGIVIWGNHLGLQLDSSNAKSVTWVDENLLFIRLALEHGQNDFEIVLTI